MSQQINLYNPALAPQRSLVSATGVAYLAAGMLTVVVLAGVVGASRLSASQLEAKQVGDQLKTVQARVQQLTQQVANAKPDPALQAEIDRLKAQVESRAGVLVALEQGITAPGNGYAEILRGLARQSLSGLWLTEVTVSAANGEMELHGRTLDRALVSDYLRRLNEEKVFAGRSFAGLRLTQGKVDDKAAGGNQKPLPYLEFSLAGSKDAPVGPMAKRESPEDGAAKETVGDQGKKS